MKKLYLVFLSLVLMFIPTSINAVAVYQLDQPVKELNNHTLREVFENRNTAIPSLIGKEAIEPNVFRLYNSNGITIDYNIKNGEYVVNGNSTNPISDSEVVITTINDNIMTLSYIYISGSVNDQTVAINNMSRYNWISSSTNTYNQNRQSTRSDIVAGNKLSIWAHRNGSYTNLRFKLQLEKGTTITPYQVPTVGPYSDIDVGQFNLTSQQIQTYYNLYLEAVRFENENIEASQDPGGYQNIFKSVINGVKGLIVEMGNVWQFLNAPIITSDMSDYSFSIDWSWDLIGVVRQLISSLAILILQTNFIFINLLFSFFGVPVQISILSMVFSNFVFVILGWIIVKSFII